jgi:hypothetical protein
MSTVSVELTFDQVMTAVQRLPLKEKATLRKALDVELDERLGNLLADLWAENRGYSEDEVAADVARAIAEVRVKRPSQSGS